MRRMIVLLVTVAVTASLTAATPAGDRPRTAEREAMDTLYSVMATMPVADRKVVFNGLTPIAKATLWSIHLEKFSTEHDLSGDQKTLVAEAVALLSPSIYALDRSSADWDSRVNAPLRAFDEKARAVFPRDLAIAAFGELGPGDATDVSLQAVPDAPHAQAIRPGSLKPVPLMPSNCTCSTVSDWCWGFSSCGISGTTCYRSTDGGCGTGWTYDCNSSCGYGPKS
jgi:hypothetical protein